MKALIKITIVLLILVSCEKTNQPDIFYDCYVKSTKFKSNDEVLIWETIHFKNDKHVKYEDSFGSITETEYDNNGNVISVSTNGSKTEYEYNSDSNIIKTTYYINNQLEYFTISIYEDTLVINSYSINSESDTIGYCNYYYNSANIKDSVICNHQDWYYYYSSEMDSIIIKSKDNLIKSKIFEKHENGRMTYSEFRNYNPEGEVISYNKTTREFNNKGFLIRRINEGLEINGITAFLDRRYFYNNSDNVLKTEDYAEANILLNYSNFIYTDSKLTKVETFDHDDNLKTYSIVENNCDNKALLPTWYSQQ